MAIVVNPQGVVGEVPDEQRDEAIAQGYAPAAPEQAAAFLAVRAKSEKFGTLGQQLITGAESAGSAATLGLSSVLERGLGVDPEAMRAREEENPISSGIGTALGIAAPMLLTGGTSGLVEGAAAGAAKTGARAALAGAAELSAPTLITKAGRSLAGALGGAGAELGVRTPGLLPQATTALGEALRHGVVEGAAAAVEGAAYGVGEVVHEAALGDPNLSGQSALATVGLSALLGGGMGGAIGITASAVPAAARAVNDAIASAFSSGEDALKGIYSRAERSTGVAGDVATFMLDNKVEIAGLERANPGFAEAMSNATPEMAAFVLEKAPQFAEFEKAFPGVTASLARADPKTAQYLLDNWQKIWTDQAQRNKAADALFTGAVDVLRATDDVLRTANKEVLPAERKALLAELGAADRDTMESTAWAIVGRAKEAVQKMQAEPDLYSAGYMRELELARQGLVRDLLTGESAETIEAGVARGASAGPGVVRSARAGEGRVITPQNTAGDAIRYEAIEVGDLIPSHKPQSFAPNPDYPVGVQERPYHSAPAEQKKVMLVGDRLDPALVLSDTPTAVDGPPIVTSGAKRFVLGGNGRTMGIQRAFASSEARENYKRELLDRAQAFGLKPEAVAKMRAPVLVRVVDGVPSNAPQADLIAAVRRYNEGLTQELSPRARAVAEAKTLRPATIESIGDLFVDTDGKSLRDLMRSKSADFIKILRRDGIITDTNVAANVTGENLTEAAKDRIEGMFLGRVVGTGERLEGTGEAVLNKVERITPLLLRVEGVNPALSEIPTVQAALDLMNRAARAGESVDEYLRQGGLVARGGATVEGLSKGAGPDAATLALVKILETENQTQIRSRFSKWAREAAVDPKQGMMFGKPPTSLGARRTLFGEHTTAADAALEARVAPAAASVEADVAAAAAPPGGAPPGAAAAAPAAPKPKSGPTSRDLFERLRTFKQQMGELAEFNKERLGMTRADRNATRLVSGVWGATKGALVDETIFGAAAVRQSVLDDIQHEWISMHGKKGAFYKQFMEPGEKGPQLSPTKISTWLNRMADKKAGTLGDIRGKRQMATWGRMMDGAKRIANEIGESSRTARVPVDIEDLRGLLEKAGQATDTAAEAAAVTLAKAGLEGRTLLSSHPIVSPAAQLAGQVGSHFVPGVVRGTVSGTFNLAKAATSVPRAVSVLAALERAGQSISDKIATAASTLVRKGAKAGNIGRAEALAGIAKSAGHDETRAKRDFKKTADRIRQLSQSPDSMIAGLSPTTADLHEHAPIVSRAIQTTQVRAVQYLAMKLPKNPEAGPLAPKWEPSRSEISDFNLHADAVDHGAPGLLKQAAAGTLTPEGVEAVRTVYPDQFAAMQSAIFEQVARHGTPPRAQRLMISMLFDADLDGSLESLAANQATFQGPSSAPSQQLPGNPKAGAVTLGERAQTDGQRSSGRA